MPIFKACSEYRITCFLLGRTGTLWYMAASQILVLFVAACEFVSETKPLVPARELRHRPRLETAFKFQCPVYDTSD